MPVNESQIVTIPLNDSRMMRVNRAAAKIAQRMGDPRAAREGLIVGLAAEMAVCLWMYGDVRRYSEHLDLLMRTGRDSGEDWVGCNLDVKGTVARGAILDRHMLAVYPVAMRPDRVYVLGVVELHSGGKTAAVHLAGWSTSATLQKIGPRTEPPLVGAYAIPARDLEPLPPIEWQGFQGSS